MKKTYTNIIAPATPSTRRMFKNLTPKGQWLYNFYISRGREVLGWFWEPTEAVKERALNWALLNKEKSVFEEEGIGFWEDWNPEADAEADIRFWLG